MRQQGYSDGEGLIGMLLAIAIMAAASGSCGPIQVDLSISGVLMGLVGLVVLIWMAS